jgi:hypothetical protein
MKGQNTLSDRTSILRIPTGQKGGIEITNFIILDLLKLLRGSDDRPSKAQNTL